MPEGADSICGIGIDVQSIERVERLLVEHEERVGEVFTQRELNYCIGKRYPAEHLAARLAAKEAAIKALGCVSGFTLDWSEIEILSDGTSVPSLSFSGELSRVVAALRIKRSHLTLSHSHEVAIAHVLLISQDDAIERNY